MSEAFYRAFEEKYRGSREIIKSRLEVYIPYILLLKEIYPDGLALDIGCGRGEWLELLKDNAVAAQGIDLDEDMLDACRDFNLNAMNAEGIAYLKSQASESLAVISSFHVVEHITFEALQTYVNEAVRVLKPGGLLILETPNPENIKVATESFYLDPTHIKPIPSGLLSFLPEFYGFERTKELRLQEDKKLVTQENISLSDVITGVSPDYGVIAQKKADTALLEEFDDLFSQEVGVTLIELTNKFEGRLQKIETKTKQSEIRAKQAESKAEQSEIKANQAHEELHSTYASYSWRMTRPLRWLNFQLLLLRQNGLVARSRALIRKSVRSIVFRVSALFASHPRLRVNLINFLQTIGLYSVIQKIYSGVTIDNFNRASSVSIGELTPSGHRIYYELKTAIEKQKKENS